MLVYIGVSMYVGPQVIACAIDPDDSQFVRTIAYPYGRSQKPIRTDDSQFVRTIAAYPYGKSQFVRTISDYLRTLKFAN